MSRKLDARRRPRGRALLRVAGRCRADRAAAQAGGRRPRKRGTTRARASCSREAQGAFAAATTPRPRAPACGLLQENIRVFGPDHPNVGTGAQPARRRAPAAGQVQRGGGRVPPHADDLRAAPRAGARVHRGGAQQPRAGARAARRLHGRRDAAAPLASPSSEKKLGKDHPDTATTLSNLSRVLDSQGKFAGARQADAAGGARRRRRRAAASTSEAETLHHQVLAIHLKTLGPDAPDHRQLDVQPRPRARPAGQVRRGREDVPPGARGAREGRSAATIPDVATNLNNLAKVMQDLGKDRERRRVRGARARAHRRRGRRP